MNVRIYLRDQYIWIFEYSNIFVTLWCGACVACGDTLWCVCIIVGFHQGGCCNNPDLVEMLGSKLLAAPKTSSKDTLANNAHIKIFNGAHNTPQKWSDQTEHSSDTLDKLNSPSILASLGWSWQWNQRYISDVRVILLSPHKQQPFFSAPTSPPFWGGNLVPIKVWWCPDCGLIKVWRSPLLPRLVWENFHHCQLHFFDININYDFNQRHFDININSDSASDWLDNMCSLKWEHRGRKQEFGVHCYWSGISANIYYSFWSQDLCSEDNGQHVSHFIENIYCLLFHHVLKIKSFSCLNYKVKWIFCALHIDDDNWRSPYRSVMLTLMVSSGFLNEYY